MAELNRETSLPDLDRGVLTANDRFYVRSHFPVPRIVVARWRLRVFGMVRCGLSLGLPELLSMPPRTMTLTLECAGNGRSLMTPPVEGEQWGLGAVSTARWTGVLLADVLGQAGVDPSAQELVFRGADRRFERSIAMQAIRSTNVLVAYAMNEEVLPLEHGYPVRAVVPGRYAVASVKWLTEIEAVSTPFNGFFQTERYVYQSPQDGRIVKQPVDEVRVRSLITHPLQGETVRPGPLVIRGWAWSGMAPIAHAEVNIKGRGWERASMLGAPSRQHWQRWEMTTMIDRRGTTSIAARATDREGNVQPEHAEWNRLGYGNNGVQVVTVEAVRDHRN